ncbi:MAG: uroporphyrinogen decarboxylase family protein [Candidatus Thorarchaeota archaeon]
MTVSRDLVDTALNGEIPERIPVAIVSTAWVYAHYGQDIREVDRDANKMADVWLAFEREFGADAICPMFSPMIIPEYYGSKLKFPEGGFPIVTEPAIKSPSDLDKMEDFDPNRDLRVAAAMDCVRELVEKLGDKRFIWLVCTGPISNASRLMDTQLIMESLIEKPDFVHDAFRFCVDAWKTALEPFLDLGIDAVDFSDPIGSPDLVSPRMYRKFFQPYDTDVVKWIQKTGIHAVYHVCGNVLKIIDSMEATGAHGLSIDAPVNLTAARNIVPKATLVGNIDPAGVIMEGTEDDVLRACRNAMETGGRTAPMILAPGCDVPPTSPAENIRAMIRAGMAGLDSS